MGPRNGIWMGPRNVIRDQTFQKFKNLRYNINSLVLILIKIQNSSFNINKDTLPKRDNIKKPKRDNKVKKLENKLKLIKLENKTKYRN